MIREQQDEWLARMVAGGARGRTLVQHHLQDVWHPPAECKEKECDAKPIYTRTIFKNELLFEGDSHRWKEVKALSEDIIKALAELAAPHILAFSGGKSIHIHVFFDPAVAIKLKEGTRLDVAKEARMFLAKLILGRALPRFYRILDWKNLSWSSDRKGSMIRAFGCPREEGTTKALIKAIPDEKITTAPAMFPNGITLWSIGRWEAELNAYLKEREEQVRAAYQPTLDGERVEVEGIPCLIHLMEKGLPTGVRDDGLFTMLNFLKNLGYTPDEARDLGLRYLQRCEPVPEDLIWGLESKVRHVWRSDYGLSRSKMHDLAGRCYEGPAKCGLCAKFR